MPRPLTASLPPDLTLSAGYILRLTALDPSTGAAVSGVFLTDVSFFVTDLNPDTTTDTTDSLEAFPLLVPLQDWP